MSFPEFVGSFSPQNDYVWITWSLLTFCNYTCRYCAIKSHDKHDITSSAEKALAFIRNLPQKNKEIALFGGEPTLHPEILKISRSAGEICENVHIFTNLSSRISMISDLESSGIKFMISYHPDIIDPERFIEKLSHIRPENIDFVNVMMVYEKDLEMETVCAFCRHSKIPHRLLPVWREGGMSDWMKSVSYSYRKDVIPVRNICVLRKEKKDTMSEQECVLAGIENFEGYFCYAGLRSLFIDHAGNVYRCQADANEGNVLCNVNSVYKIPESYRCSHSRCTCEYYIPKEQYRMKNYEFLS